jgi:hypothetical protein
MTELACNIHCPRKDYAYMPRPETGTSGIHIPGRSTTPADGMKGLAAFTGYEFPSPPIRKG